jgi:hypothetical protein
MTKLAVPEFDSRVPPDAGTKNIAGRVTETAKEDAPEFQPLLIGMMNATLVRSGGGKENHVAEGGEVGYKAF